MSVVLGGQRGQVTHVVSLARPSVREKALKRGSEILCPAGNHVLDWSGEQNEENRRLNSSLSHPSSLPANATSLLLVYRAF